MNNSDIKLKTKTITCVDCNTEFIFSVGEQCFYLSKGLAEPKRCSNCRKARKDTLNISKGVIS